MSYTHGKRLLILGGTAASLDLVKLAKEMGIYTIVTDDREHGIAKDIADEKAMVSTTDIDELVALVKEKGVDGVFCSPSEFQIRNAMQVCEKAGLPFYANKKQWANCSNKETLKAHCAKAGLPVIPEYHFSELEELNECPDDLFPVIVKPVDGASSRGVSVCHTRMELSNAVSSALKQSRCGDALVEKYIDNGGRLFSFRYFLDGDNSFPYFLMDTYIADPKNKKKLISAFSYAPSEYAEHFLDQYDHKIRKMFQGMGLRNGTVFAQALPYNDEFYCHDMGLRLSGGMTFRMCEHLTDINDMKMMIRLALGGPICTEEDLQKMNPNPKNGVVGQLMVPLNSGTISSIEGIDAIRKEPTVISYIQYYNVGDTITENAQGTLIQQFARISIAASSKEDLVSIVNRLQDNISIKNTNGEEMFTMRFDTNRLYQ